jgi:DNA-binding LacI/PurR family transcriptional regulator
LAVARWLVSLFLILSSGLAVPRDISIAGFDDIPIAEYGPVPLTTMRVPTYEIGRKGAGLLLAALGDDDVADIELFGQIVERDSVAPVRSAS